METRSESSAKRARDQQVSSVENYENYAKTPRLSHHDKHFLRDLIRESEYITGEVIKNSIRESEEKHFDYMKNLIKESEKKILSVIENKIDNIKSDLSAITERVKSLELKYTEVEHLKKEITEIKRKMLKQENTVVASSIRISGVPYNDNENLHGIVQNICNSLKINMPQLENIYRLKKIYRNNKPFNPTDEVIVAKLCSPFEKNYLLKCIAKFRSENKTHLCLRQAGFDSDEPIYINENLTPHNHKIFKEALLLKKNKKIKSTFSLRGLVYVKKFDLDDPVLIEFSEDLHRLFLE